MNPRYFFLLLPFFCVSPRAAAFPEMVRHGYVSCSVCHSSSAGGEILTKYGQSLAKELVSENRLWFQTSEEFKKDLPDYLDVALNIRGLQIFKDNSQQSSGRFIWMQTDLDLLLNYNRKLFAYASAGRIEPKNNNSQFSDTYYFPRIWLGTTINNESEDRRLSLRYGRFHPNYGINIQEHNIVTRRILELGPGQERLQGQLVYEDERLLFSISSVIKQFTYAQSLNEEGWVSQIVVFPIEKVRFGLNGWRTKKSDLNVASEGSFLIAGISESDTLMFEIDRIYGADGKSGYLNYFKFDREWSRGRHLFFTQEYWNANIEKTDPKFEAIGLGTQWIPTDYLDMQAAFRLEKNSAVLDEYQRVILLNAHFIF